MNTIDDENQTVREYKRYRKHNAQSLPPGITHDMMKKYVVYYRETFDHNGKTRMREYFKVERHPKLMKINTKPYITTKSCKVSLLEKLEDANKVVTELEDDIFPISHFKESNSVVNNSDINNPVYSVNKDNNVENVDILKAEQIKKWTKHLPKYISIRDVRENHSTNNENKTVLAYFSLYFDKKDRINMFRWTTSHRFCIDIQSIIPNLDDGGIISHEIQRLREKIILKYGTDVLSIA
jgi:hypothetical protein